MPMKIVINYYIIFYEPIHNDSLMTSNLMPLMIATKFSLRGFSQCETIVTSLSWPTFITYQMSLGWTIIWEFGLRCAVVYDVAELKGMERNATRRIFLDTYERF